MLWFILVGTLFLFGVTPFLIARAIGSSGEDQIVLISKEDKHASERIQALEVFKYGMGDSNIITEED